jgi:predicted ATPase
MRCLCGAEECVVELVGRAGEMAQLRMFLAACRDGLSALTIEGEPGIGKTALFGAAVAAASGMRVLRVRCVDAESSLAYAGLADLLGAWTETAASTLPLPQRRALEIALLRADRTSEPVEPHAVGRAVLEVLRLWAMDAPVLVAIDDAQWLDAATARAVTFAVRRLDGVPIGVLATWRTTDGPPPLRLDELIAPARRHRLVVGPLLSHDLGELLDHRFPDPVSPALRSRVLAAAAGNPLYAIELVAEHLASDRSLEDLLTLPARLEELLAGRLDRLPEAAAEPLAAVASLAAPTVASVVGALGADAQAGLAHAMDEHVLRVSEGRLWFSHPLLGVAAVNRLAPSARRALHRRLAAAVSSEEERGRHLVLSADGPDGETAAAAERAADLARARGAPEVAGAAGRGRHTPHAARLRHGPWTTPSRRWLPLGRRRGGQTWARAHGGCPRHHATRSLPHPAVVAAWDADAPGR